LSGQAPRHGFEREEKKLSIRGVEDWRVSGMGLDGCGKTGLVRRGTGSLPVEDGSRREIERWDEVRTRTRDRQCLRNEGLQR